MNTQPSPFNHTLLIVLAALYLITLAGCELRQLAHRSSLDAVAGSPANIPILSIPLVLLYGSVYVLIAAWREHARQRLRKTTPIAMITIQRPVG